MYNMIPVLPSHEVDGLFSMQGVLLFVPLNCDPKLHFLPLRLNILLCPWPFEISFQLWNYLMRLEAGTSKSYALKPLYTAEYLKTTPVPLSLLVSHSYAHELNTSMFATITSRSMYELDSSRFYP